MSYHNTGGSSRTTTPSTTTSQRQAAPAGYHYMPDGSLMLNSEMIVDTPAPAIAVTAVQEVYLEEINPDSTGDTIVSPNLVDSFTIDTSDMPSAETIRTFTVTGSIGAEFTIVALQEDTIKYYDFSSKVFSDGHTASKNLKIVMAQKALYGDITFPSGGEQDKNYIIKLIPKKNTILANNKNIFSQSLKKISTVPVVTFKASTANTSSYKTFPTSVSTGSIGGAETISFSWKLENVDNDSNGFGLITTGSFEDLNNFKNLWFFTTTETVNGAISVNDANKGLVLKVDDLTDIGVGSQISGVDRGTLIGTPVVTKINLSTKELYLSIAQTFVDDAVLTFKTTGLESIKAACGVDVRFKFNKTDELPKQEKTIRAGSSGTTINLNGTYGIGHNDVSATIGGGGITTASVVSVAASESAGSIVVSASQGTLTTGTTIYLKGIHREFNIAGEIALSSYPSADKTIFLDIDQFLTPGTEN
tara:strand:- start:1507 stop:2931 length:1425 start_codon:yes stop_codon:yes gene_type:complete